MVEPTQHPIFGGQPHHTPFTAQNELDTPPTSENLPPPNSIDRQLKLTSPIPEKPYRGCLLIDQSHSTASKEAHSDERPDVSNPKFELRAKIKPWVDALVDHGTKLGLLELHTRWMLDELITNALQYGAPIEGIPSSSSIRVEWEFLPDGSQHNLAFAVSNPSRYLFDPTRYARMTIAEFFDMESSGSNAHEGTNTLLAFLKPGTPLTYLWELKDGGHIHLAVHPIPENAPDKPANYDELKRPVTMDILRTDSSKREMPYSFERFLQDIEQSLPCERVTVSGMLSSIS